MMTKGWRTWLVTSLALGFFAIHSTGSKAAVHLEGFEDPGWTAGQPGNWQNYNGNEIERVSSGHNGINSSSGSGHAIISTLGTNNNVFGVPTLGALGPYTTLGGYSSSFNGGFTVSLDVYLDPNWANGQGFDYSAAASNQSGNHLRDFIFHVGVVEGNLLVNASNNSDWSFNAFKLTNENGGNNYTVGTAGWYTFEHVFYDDGGVLSVDMNLLDDGSTVLHSITRNTADDIAATVGGNRYAWLVFNNVQDLAIDNATLDSLAAVPEPSTILVWLGLGACGVFGCVRRQRAA